MSTKTPQRLQLVKDVARAKAEAERPQFLAERPWQHDARHLPSREWIYGKHYLLWKRKCLNWRWWRRQNVARYRGSRCHRHRAQSDRRADQMGVWRNRALLQRRGTTMRNRTARLCRMSALQHRPRGRAGATNDAGLYIASGHDFPICIARAGPRGIIFDSAIVDAIEDYISVNNINVVIVDPFVSTHNVPENDNTAINAVVGAWKRLADRCRISVMLVHHTRKPLQGGTVENTVGDARGASALIDAVRSALVLNKMTQAEAVRADVENPRGYFRCDNGKANYARQPDDSTWFKLIEVTLPNDHDGQDDFYARSDPDAVGVVTAWRFPQLFDNVTPDHMRRVREMARTGSYRADPQSDNWIGHAVAEVLDLDSDDKDDRKRIRAILKTWIKNAVLREVDRKDDKRMTRTFIEPGDWQY